MAASPVKSQPLHEFPLLVVEWGDKSKTKKYRSRRPDHHQRAHPPPEHSYQQYSNGDEEKGTYGDVKNYTEPRGVRNRSNASASCSLIGKPSKQALKEERNAEAANYDESSSVQKPWNLRPRKGLVIGGCDGVGLKNGTVQNPIIVAHQQSEAKSTRLSVKKRGTKEKVRLWIAVSKEELEEDIYAMTRSKPSRKPMKRSKDVQKHLEGCLPGSQLDGLSADDFRVRDPPAKR